MVGGVVLSSFVQYKKNQLISVMSAALTALGNLLDSGDGRTPVTAKSLAYEAEISISAARDACRDYAVKNASDVFALAVLTGHLKSKQAQKAVKLVPWSNIEEAKEAFESVISEHIYSIRRATPENKAKDVEAEATDVYNVELRRKRDILGGDDLEKMNAFDASKWADISTDAEIFIDPTKFDGKLPLPRTLKGIVAADPFVYKRASNPVAAAKPAFTAKASAASKGRKVTKPKKVTDKKAFANFFGSSKDSSAKKKSTAPASTIDEAAKDVVKAEKKKRQRRNVIMDDDDDDEDDEVEEKMGAVMKAASSRTETTASVPTKYANIEEEEYDNEDDDVTDARSAEKKAERELRKKQRAQLREEEKEARKKQKLEQKRQEKAAAVKKAKDRFMSSFGGAETSAPSQAPASAPAAPGNAGGKKTVRRLKSKSYVNDKGYFVTEDVWEEVPIEDLPLSERPPTQQKAKPAQASRKPAKRTQAKKKMKTGSISSFFKKR